LAVKYFPRRVREVEDSDLIATEAAHTAIFPGERHSGHLSFLFSLLAFKNIQPCSLNDVVESMVRRNARGQ
jgi:hypothetical protein